MITLGIIGIIAAVTMPSLIGHWQKKVLETQYKRGVTVLSNGFQLMMAKNDVPGDLTSLPLVSCTWSKICFEDEYEKYFPIVTSNPEIEEISTLRYRYLDADTNFLWIDSTRYTFITSDGIIYGHLQTGTNYDSGHERASILVVMDVNGLRKPNVIGEDFYILEIDYRGNVTDKTEQADDDRGFLYCYFFACPA